jgi:hypothetical protein
VLSGAHAASGRHVSTWAHAVLSGKVSSLWGDLIHESHDSEGVTILHHLVCTLMGLVTLEVSILPTDAHASVTCRHWSCPVYFL